ncbi:MAG: aspartate carbamoyltransferase, partial [Clostridia bacterium]|nr:aspartate carbamoyltransferase [Clostridia bacterium]
AGDGGHFHPTQTLIDLFTIKQKKETLSGLTIGLCGDLKNGRTVHSLLRALNTLGKNTYYLISTETLSLQSHIIEQLRENGNTVYEVTSLEACLDKLDVLYMTRIQKERFASEEQYKEQSGRYILDKAKMDIANPEMIVLHPLPRVDEITEEVDYDPRAMYFKQVQNGLYVRMALIIKMLEARKGEALSIDIEKYMDLPRVQKCNSNVCITKSENYLPLLTYKTPDGGTACMYCDHKID